MKGYLVGDRVSLKVLLKLHALSPTASCSFTIQVDEQILNLPDEQNWAVMSDEWAHFMFGSVGGTVKGSPGTELKNRRKKTRKILTIPDVMTSQDKFK